MTDRPQGKADADWGLLIDLTKQMIRLASAGQWDDLRDAHLERDRCLKSVSVEQSRQHGTAESIRALSELNRVLTDLAERERQYVASRLVRLRRDTGACSAYKRNASAESAGE